MAGTVGDRIKAARQARDMTQGEVGIACGWSDDPVEAQSRISNYERNKREPTLVDLAAIAAVLKVDPAELAFGHPLKPDPVEAKMISAYRQADTQGKKFIVGAYESTLPDRREKKRRNVK
jgi:transcriptional regulator with XRE-family HTH domain